MAEPAARLTPELTTRASQPLIGIPTTEDAEEVVRYFTSEADADRALAHQDRDGVQRALNLIGAWEHLDAEDGPDMLDELDRLRHESRPTPPLEL